MAFMALSIQHAMLVQQKTQLEYEEMVASNHYDYVTSQLSSLEQNNCDMESSQVKALENYQELYKSKQSTIEAQLEEINAEISSFEKAQDTNIKNDCKFTITA